MGEFLDNLPAKYNDVVSEPVDEQAVLRLRKVLEVGVLEAPPVKWGYIVHGDPVAKEEKKCDVHMVDGDVSDEEMLSLNNTVAITAMPKPVDDSMTD